MKGKRKPMVVYTDGSFHGCGRNPKAGVGVWFGRGDPRNISETLSVVEEPMIARAEMTAIIRALQLIPANTKAVIYTDSILIIDGLVCMESWKCNGWIKTNGKLVANQDLWNLLDSLYTPRSTQVEIRYCKAHSGIEGNIGADALAKLAAGARLGTALF